MAATHITYIMNLTDYLGSTMVVGAQLIFNILI